MLPVPLSVGAEVDDVALLVGVGVFVVVVVVVALFDGVEVALPDVEGDVTLFDGVEVGVPVTLFPGLDIIGAVTLGPGAIGVLGHVPL